MIMYAMKRDKDIRWHERGDWFKDGELDREYIDNVVEACEGLVAQGHKLPKMWFYTHIYDSYIVDSLSPYCTVYASVHNIADKREAEVTRIWNTLRKNHIQQQRRGEKNGKTIFLNWWLSTTSGLLPARKSNAGGEKSPAQSLRIQ